MFRTGEVEFRLRSRRNRAGQSTVEYMLVLSVIVMGIYLATEVFRTPFGDGLTAMQSDIRIMVSDGYVGGRE